MAERLSLGTEQPGILILTGYFEALLSVDGVSKRKGESWPLQKGARNPAGISPAKINHSAGW